MKHLSSKKIFALIGVFLVVFISAGVIFWFRSTHAPTEEAINALKSDGQVRITEAAGSILFEPANTTPHSGLIFYPGAGVDYRSYAPVLRRIASQGFLVVAPSMPLNLAFFGANRADQVIADYPGIETWAIGGHSLGGVVAARYAARHPDVNGMVFWASYPANDSLRESSVNVLSIYGSQDGLATPEQIADSQSLLPPDAVFDEIEGGNHSQFGSYGFQSGDLPASISPEEQWTQMADTTVEFLAEMEE